MSRVRSHLPAIVWLLLPLSAVPLLAGVVIDEFEGPLFGLDTAPNGDIVVADSGRGIVSIGRGRRPSVIPLPGITDVSTIGRGSMWAVTGATGGPEAGSFDTGQALHRVSQGRSKQVVNLFAFERAHNPDGGGVDSNPFDVHSLGGNAALVIDAAGNDLLEIDTRGRVDVLALLPDELVSTDNLKRLAGCPGPAAFCELPDTIPAQSVPTSIALNNAWIFVGELKGFPGPLGESNIWRVSPGARWAQCGSSPDCVKVFDGGFTSIIDMTFGPNGLLYVAELDEASWAAVEIIRAPVGGTINACDVIAGSCYEVATGIPELTAINFGKDGSLWATRHSLETGAAEVVRIH